MLKKVKYCLLNKMLKVIMELRDVDADVRDWLEDQIELQSIEFTGDGKFAGSRILIEYIDPLIYVDIGKEAVVGVQGTCKVEWKYVDHIGLYDFFKKTYTPAPTTQS